LKKYSIILAFQGLGENNYSLQPALKTLHRTFKVKKFKLQYA